MKVEYKVHRKRFTDDKAMQKYLNEVAQEGWRLINKEGFLFTWERNIHKKPGPKKRKS